MVASFAGTDNVQLYTGGIEVDVQLDGDRTQPGKPPAAAVLPFLRRYGELTPGPLAAPALPGRFLRALTRTARILSRTGDSRATARALHLSLGRVRERLWVRRALRRFGHIDAAPC